MAITVDYDVTPFLITIPKSDLTLDSGTKYKLTVDDYWQLLSDYSDGSESMPHQLMYSRIPATSSTPSITEIELAYYELQFEDGAYSINIINGNTNIREAEVKNQVSVNTNNTTGFIDPTFLQHGTYESGVTIDVINGVSGIAYPIGIASDPVDNLIDANTILITQTLSKFLIVGNITISSGTLPHIWHGQSRSKTLITCQTGAILDDAEFEFATIEGTLDTNAIIHDCDIMDLAFFDGRIRDSLLRGEITLGGGGKAIMSDCKSEIGASIDMGGTGQSLEILNHNGTLTIKNLADAAEICDIYMNSGKVIIDPTCTAGMITIHGTATVTNNSTGTTIVDTSEMIDGLLINQIHGQLERSVFIDTEKVVNGNGYQQTPYNNFTDAVDYAEAHNLFDLIVHADATIDRQLKNFVIKGIGNPIINLNGQIFDKSTFERVTLTGSHLGDIQANECALFNISGLRGVFLTCSLAGTITPASGSQLLISRVAPAVAAQPWTLDMNTGAASTVAIHNLSGGMIIDNMDDAGDVLHILMSQGEIIINASCTAGEIVIGGNSRVTDNSNGTTVIRAATNSEILLDAIA